jgi:2-oxoglutarate ferredoxin oxidoreductase subunit beta
MATIENITAKDFATDRDVRWCPGCGDYSILKQVQSVAAEMGWKKHETVFVSGIGCSSRFPYYMDTFGLHGIHGRATAIAGGLKAARPDLNVWVITGDGDSLSIGGNHLIHLLRRNFDLNVLLFNNEIYGLTKGQYSPTSPEGKITKSSPMGAIDHEFNPIALCLGADATFVARSIDRDPVHMRKVLKSASAHKGTSLVEIYQNCNVFNDGAFSPYTDKDHKGANVLMMEHEQPLVFGDKREWGIRLDGFTPVVVSLEEGGVSVDDLWIHNESDQVKAGLLSRFFDAPGSGNLPRPFGIFYKAERTVYEQAMQGQIEESILRKGVGNLDELLAGNATWSLG